MRDGGPATSAALSFPQFAARDQRGNIYVTDYFGHRIRKITPAGIISTAVGNGISGFSGDGGQAKHANVSFPSGILFDTAGNLLFSDKSNNRIRKVDASGIITTIAGNGTAGYSGDGGPATAASLNAPRGMALDNAGNLYFADSNNNVVRKIDTSGIITTVAGNGTAGFSGDGGPATLAMLNQPFGVFVNRGSLYIADYSNERVRKVDTSGTITTFAGNGSFGCTGDGGSATLASIGRPKAFVISGSTLLISTSGCSRVRAVDLRTNVITTSVGSASGFDGGGNPPLVSLFEFPHGLFLDQQANLVVVDAENNRLRKVDSSSGTVITIAGGYTGDGGPASESSLNMPQGFNFDSAGNLLIADSFNERIRKVDTTGKITTIAGSGISGYTGDGGPATAATLSVPMAVAADQAGNVYIADQFGSALRKVDTSGTINTVAVSGFFGLLTGLAADPVGDLFAADAELCVIWKITPTGTMSRVAGASDFSCGYNGDGIAATKAMLNEPWAVAFDAQGNLLIADTSNNRIRSVDYGTGLINTLAGDGDCSFSGDGGPATSAALCLPFGVAANTSGTLFIADTENFRIRSVSAGTIQTLAGTGVIGYNGNGLPGTQTNLDFPMGMAVNRAGIPYELDEEQGRVRKIQ